MDDQYDEFGNFLGELSDGEGGLDDGFDDDGGLADEELDEMERRAAERDAGGDLNAGDEGAMEVDAVASTAVVLHEDKQYYPTAEEVYGQGTEAVYHDEDAQDLNVPLLAPKKEAATTKIAAAAKETAAEDDGAAEDEEDFPMVCNASFLRGLSSTPAVCRNVAFVGHLHHGKTAVLDMLVRESHRADALPPGGTGADPLPMRYTDAREDERARRMSVKLTPITCVAEGGRGKSYALTVLDCPGHADFSDELAAAGRIADGAVVVVDAAEGVMLSTERALKAAVREGLKVCLVINKLDRLVTELKLPPNDTYFKIKHTIEEVNAILAGCTSGVSGDGVTQRVDPVVGNVCFSSASYGFCFSLLSFARLYADVHGMPVDARAFSARLWGDMYYNPATRGFRKKPPAESMEPKRSFVEFVLEPMYKIFSLCVGEHPKSVARALETLGVNLPPAAYKQDVRPLLRDACVAVFGDMSSLVDMMVEHVPAIDEGVAAKVDLQYTGPSEGVLATAMRKCDPAGPLVVHVTKLYQRGDGSCFDAYGRVMSGTLRTGAGVRVLGEAYSPEDEEDMAVKTVEALWLYQARYRVPVSEARAGQLVLIGGVDATISKTATIIAEESEFDEEPYIFRPLQFDARSVVKVAVEPLNPSELPKVVEGLRSVNKSYPLAVTKVEESGEHTILGTGEVFLDSVMRDLREMYSNVEVKVSDPVTCFRESVAETSSLKCYAETPNGKNKLTMVAEPLDRGLAEDIEGGAVSLDWPRRRQASFFTEKYEWDALAARSVWAFGPEPANGPNAFLDDTLPSEVDKSMLNAIKDSVAQGFRWGSREGPLCDEPVRGVKWRLLDAVVADEPMHRGGGQVIPTARRAIYSSFLTAAPRLMEPVYHVEVQTPADCLSAIYTVLSKRRGHVLADTPKPGTPVFSVKAYLPAIESFGFETDLRVHTQGQAFSQMVFDHWALVPGDPLDRGVVLRPLEPQPTQHLAREFTVKTRRRKGMAEEVSVSRFLDDPALLELARADETLASIL